MEPWGKPKDSQAQALYNPMASNEWRTLEEGGSRRVLVLRLGVWGLGVDAKSVRSVRKRSPCVRKRPPCVRKRPPCVRKRPRRKSSRNAELSSLFDSRLVLASQKCQQSQGSGGSWSRNTVVTFGLAFGPRVSTVSAVTGIGGVVVAKYCRHFWTCVWSSLLKSVNSHRDGGVVVAKCRTVVTFGLGRETQKRGERREEKRGREKREEKREERRERRAERREERG